MGPLHIGDIMGLCRLNVWLLICSYTDPLWNDKKDSKRGVQDCSTAGVIAITRRDRDSCAIISGTCVISQTYNMWLLEWQLLLAGNSLRKESFQRRGGGRGRECGGGEKGRRRKGGRALPCWELVGPTQGNSYTVPSATRQLLHRLLLQLFCRSLIAVVLKTMKYELRSLQGFLATLRDGSPAKPLHSIKWKSCTLFDLYSKLQVRFPTAVNVQQQLGWITW